MGGAEGGGGHIELGETGDALGVDWGPSGGVCEGKSARTNEDGVDHDGRRTCQGTNKARSRV